MGGMGFLRQFAVPSFVIVCDDDVNTRDWNDVIWAITTHGSGQDTTLIEIRRLIIWTLPHLWPV